MGKKREGAGLRGQVAGETALSTVGKEGKGLTYRGYAIEDLAEKATFEEVAYMLLYGKLPNQDEYDSYTCKLRKYRDLPRELKNVLKAIKNADLLVIHTEWNEYRGLDLLKVKKQLKNPIILDLRNNPGGLLSEAISVSDSFLELGEIVSTRGRDGKDSTHHYSRPGDIINGLPLVVLINSGSASASEIVAGALKDHKRAIIIGENSYGKGSVQSIIPLKNKGAIRLTVSKYYLPSGKSISEIGVSPDIEIAEGSDDFRFNTDTDNQLQFALELLNG